MLPRRNILDCFSLFFSFYKRLIEYQFSFAIDQRFGIFIKKKKIFLTHGFLMKTVGFRGAREAIWPGFENGKNPIRLLNFPERWEAEGS